MSRNKFYIAIFVVIIITALFLNIWQRRTKFIDTKIGSHYYRLEIANTDARRVKGLSGRDSLGENEGMIFKFPYAGRYIFWMKDMKFPIDIIWLQDNEIIDLTPSARPEEQASEASAAPHSQASEGGFTRYTPRLPANRVIELNAGIIQKESLKIGDTISSP